MKIHVKESTIVKPTEGAPRHSLWLSNVDLIQVRMHMGTLHFYKAHPSSGLRGTQILKDALRQVLVPYYPAAGRLRRGKNGRLEVECNGEGVLFVEAETDSTVNDMGVLVQSLDLAQLIPAVDYSVDISSYPLLLLQVTYFKCGGICIGGAIHHTFGDGASFMHLMEAWAQTVRRLPIKETPFLDRTILRAHDPPSPAFSHTEYQPPPFHNPPAAKSSVYKPTPQTDSTIITLKLTPLQLKALKAKAKISGGGDYSTYAVLVAHIWRCACFAGGEGDLTENQVTRLSIIIDGRSRLRPKLPPGYLGNALFHARPAALSSHLRREPLGRTAQKIHGEIRKMTNEYLRSAIDYLEKHPDMEELVPKEGNPIFQCTTFCIVDWTKKNIYELDFGWGGPFYVRHANLNDGKGFITESPQKDGSLMLTICLKRAQVLKFQRLFYKFPLLPISPL